MTLGEIYDYGEGPDMDRAKVYVRTPQGHKVLVKDVRCEMTHDEVSFVLETQQRKPE